MLARNNFPKCVGCGYCCIMNPCTHGIYATGLVEIADYGERCKFLFWDGAKYRCQAVIDDPQFALQIAAGIGCPSSLNSWKNDAIKR